MERDVVILGCASGGPVVLETLRAAGRPVHGFLDDNHAVGTDVLGAKVVGSFSRAVEPEFLAGHDFIVAVGDQETRRLWSERIEEAGGTLASAVHPTAWISEHARIGGGTLIHAFAAILNNADVGRFCVVHAHGSVGHDVTLGDGVFLGPGCQITGGGRIGDRAFLGAGAVTVPNVRIGAGCVVGAGAVVVSDLADGSTAAGNPARRVPQIPRESR